MKLKTWSNSYKKMLEVVTMDYERDICTARDAEGTHYTQPYPMKKGVLCNPTGEFDVKGREIYQHDILIGWHASDYDVDDDEDLPALNKRGKFTTLVQFRGGAYAVDAPGGDYDTTAIGWAMEADFFYRIIGNKFENPDLLPNSKSND